MPGLVPGMFFFAPAAIIADFGPRYLCEVKRLIKS